MNRRKFLAFNAAAGLGALLPGFARAADGDPWRRDFANALASNPFLQGYRSAPPQLACERLKIEGRVPAGLRGTLYRNGPALHEFGGLRYHHWFDGDGMVQAFRFSDARVSHVGRFVQTSKRRQEQRAGRALYNGFGTAVPDALALSSADDGNVANTSVLPHAGELLALWEGGSAYELNPQSLETIGRKVWRADLKGAPFSAHPKVDPSGVMWNFGLFTPTSTLVLYQISARGELVKASALQVPNLAMIHDFAVTARHLVFLVPPMRFDRASFAAGASFLDAHAWVSGAPLRALVVEKADLRTHRLYELPAGFVFHFGNAWEDQAGVIRFDYVRRPDATTMTTHFRELMRGNVLPPEPAETHVVTLPRKKGAAVQDRVAGMVEFPRVDPRVVGARYRQLYRVARTTTAARHMNAVQRVDLDSGEIDTFEYGEAFVAEEHVLVPKPGTAREGAAWLLGTALDVPRRRTVISVFDALNLSAGPIARASLPYSLPLGFHGNFQAA